MAEQRPKFRFDPTINLGHVLTFVGLVGTGLLAYSLLERRVTVQEFHQVRAVEDNAALKHEMREATRELRQDMKEVQKAVTELTTSIRAARAEDRR